MQAEEFQTFLSDHEVVRDALYQALATRPARGFDLAVEAAGLVLLFPLIRFMLMEIGLPWLTTLKRYSELQRRQVEDWIDRQAESKGVDPEALEAASRKLIQELERTSEARARKQWERLRELLRQ